MKLTGNHAPPHALIVITSNVAKLAAASGERVIAESSMPKLVQAAATQGRIQIELRRVAEVIIHQLNMIIATRGTARVTSFFAPYACDRCGREESIVIDAVANAAQLAQMQAPAMTCPECRGAMAFNDFPERYFSFLSGS